MLHFDTNSETKQETNEQQEKKEFSLITEGEYEATLSAEWAKTKGGDTYINCVFKIRDDVEQEFKSRLVFDGIYKSKTTGDYPSAKINSILATIPNAKIDFEDYDELIQYINGANMIVGVKIREAENGYKARNEIVYLSYKPTQHPVETKRPELEPINDDTLPF